MAARKVTWNSQSTSHAQGRSFFPGGWKSTAGGVRLLLGKAGIAHFLDFLEDGDTLRLRIHAPRFDAAAARDFKAEVESRWPGTVKRLDIDLRGVEFLDSSGVGALLSVHKRFSNGGAGGVVNLLNVKPAVRAVFALMRMHRVFNIHGE